MRRGRGVLNGGDGWMGKGWMGWRSGQLGGEEGEDGVVGAGEGG